MVTFTIAADRLKHILVTACLRKNASDYIFENIVVTFFPEGVIKVMNSSSYVFNFNVYSGIQVSGITEETRMAIRGREFIESLESFTGNVKVTSDVANSEWVIEDAGEGSKKRKKVYIPMIGVEEVNTAAYEAPFPINECGIPLLRGGTVPMNIIAELSVEVFKDLVKEVDRVKMDPRFFTIELDNEDKVVKTFAGDRNQRSKRRVESQDDVISLEGSCVSSFALGFENVVQVLDGIIRICTVSSGPMWVTQSLENETLQYMISPAAK